MSHSLHTRLTGAQGASGPQGAKGPYWAQGAMGANGPPGPGTGSSSEALSFSNHDGVVLVITADGMVDWKGPPSKAADVLDKTIGNLIDSKAATAGMRQRTYVRACQSLLNKAKSMDKEEFIYYLESSIENRTSKAVLLAIKDLETDEDN